MKSFKFFAVIAFLIATSAQAKDSPKNNKESLPAKESVSAKEIITLKASPSCMVPLSDSQSIRFVSVHSVRYVQINEYQSNKLLVGFDNGVELTFTYKSKDESVTALNKLVKDINTCGQ
jgi:opacity protein-like surface antigen